MYSTTVPLIRTITYCTHWACAHETFTYCFDLSRRRAFQRRCAAEEFPRSLVDD